MDVKITDVGNVIRIHVTIPGCCAISSECRVYTLEYHKILTRGEHGNPVRLLFRVFGQAKTAPIVRVRSEKKGDDDKASLQLAWTDSRSGK